MRCSASGLRLVYRRSCRQSQGKLMKVFIAIAVLAMASCNRGPPYDPIKFVGISPSQLFTDSDCLHPVDRLARVVTITHVIEQGQCAEFARAVTAIHGDTVFYIIRPI
jgi:hypothetical protein